ncbi:fimbrial chaperone protein [Chania multitudinisentens RB-25]|uniref:Fimbrial chaperone protein n=1 Tax=Chania multitudinisentens RB-25 TaxID=1441930 RepID=W0L977_9GAMM|nr:molecular chaperone [Chania multitudinisentens]AHG18914.1 fimbrial chaperone protein [Chania multitudinisentens RB-25]
MNSLFCWRPAGWLLCLLAVCANTARAQTAPANPQGISFHVLRVIYMESDRKGVTLTANNTAPLPYLMQSWIQPVDPQTGNVPMASEKRPTMPFIVTPPLARLEPNNVLTLRIRRNSEPLPADRESVFFISMKAIPTQTAPDKQAPKEQMVLTVVSNMKIFYRPEGLAKRAVEDMAPKLQFRREGNQLIVENPTPYWLTFSSLKVGTVALDKTQLRLMVPPKGQQRYPLPDGALGNVTWQLIDEDGWSTPAEQRPL